MWAFFDVSMVIGMIFNLFMLAAAVLDYILPGGD